VLLGTAGLLVIALRLPEALIGAAATLTSDFWDDNQPLMLAFVLARLTSPILGALLVIWREPLAERLFPPGAQPETPTSLPTVIQGVFLALGVFFVTSGATHLVAPAAAALSGDRAILEDPSAYAAALEIAVGLAIILGWRGMIGAVRMLRNAGRKTLNRGPDS